jgi:O-6-methylguanine DNA methyltransferase
MTSPVVRALTALRGARAPRSVLPAVLVRVGAADRYSRIDTPIGPVFVAHDRNGISAVMRTPTPADFERAFRARFGRRAYAAAGMSGTLARAVGRRLHGSPPARLRLDLCGLTAFEQAVLRQVLTIPRGEVRPYSWVAREMGRPRAVRAVGMALARNPIPLLIPCHRVVRSDGRVGAYVLGTQRKRALLTAEGVDLKRMESLARHRVHFVGSETTHIFCYPTCERARRITTLHRVLFRAAAEASAMGYRPCKVCRPAPTAGAVMGRPGL